MSKPDIQSLFDKALQRASTEERTAYLEDACRGDANLRQRLEELLAAHDQAGSFLQGSASQADTGPQPATEAPGTMIGSYKLVEPIGQGGMGIVYLAEQQQPVRRSVAIKIIKPGMDTRAVIARFEAERQALALMDHPNIARVLDAGATQAGRPYFVMELVRGVPITEYCDQERLPIIERLRLFITACRAVQHAHQQGIIHRDLKPSNLLITLHDGEAVLKVIDFGVAKAITGRLTDRTLHTGLMQIIGTPPYMSPQQADFAGQHVDTRSDVYSLGVILYELLTGQTPLDRDTLRKVGYDEFRRMVREEEPPKPSTRVRHLRDEAVTLIAGRRGSQPQKLAHHLRGDLDWIVMKALERDRHRRYESASALAADIERYLRHEPVEAMRPSAVYRLRKLLQRRRAAAIGLACLILALLIGTTSFTWFVLHEWTKMQDSLRAHAMKPDGTEIIGPGITFFPADEYQDRLEIIDGQIYVYGAGGQVTLPFPEVPLTALAVIYHMPLLSDNTPVPAKIFYLAAEVIDGKVVLDLRVNPELPVSSRAKIFVYVTYRKKVPTEKPIGRWDFYLQQASDPFLHRTRNPR